VVSLFCLFPQFFLKKNLPVTFCGLAKVGIFTILHRCGMDAEKQSLINQNLSRFGGKCVCGAGNWHFC